MISKEDFYDKVIFDRLSSIDIEDYQSLSFIDQREYIFFIANTFISSYKKIYYKNDKKKKDIDTDYISTIDMSRCNVLTFENIGKFADKYVSNIQVKFFGNSIEFKKYFMTDFYDTKFYFNNIYSWSNFCKRIRISSYDEPVQTLLNY